MTVDVEVIALEWECVLGRYGVFGRTRELTMEGQRIHELSFGIFAREESVGNGTERLEY